MEGHEGDMSERAHGKLDGSRKDREGPWEGGEHGENMAMRRRRHVVTKKGDEEATDIART